MRWLGKGYIAMVRGVPDIVYFLFFVIALDQGIEYVKNLAVCPAGSAWPWQGLEFRVCPEAKVPLAQWVAEKRLVAPAHLAAANAIEFGMPLIDVTAFDPAHHAVKLVSEELIQKHQVLPLFKRGGKLFVGTSNPTQTAALTEIQFHTNLVVEPVLVDDDQLRRTLDQWLNAASNLSGTFGGDDDEGLDNLEVGTDDDMGAGSDSAVDAKGDDTPVVKFVNKVLVDAIKRGASDIHFEPYETDYRVRLRIDGILKQVAKAPVKLSSRIAARLKVMSQLDIAEKRVPQDGRIKLNLSKTKQIDFRVSTLPTLFGEKIVLRILDGSAAKLGIEKLGRSSLVLRTQFRGGDELRLRAVAIAAGEQDSIGRKIEACDPIGVLLDRLDELAGAGRRSEPRIAGLGREQRETGRGGHFDHGDAGVDTVDYSYLTTGVTVTLSGGGATVTAVATRDGDCGGDCTMAAAVAVTARRQRW